MTRKHRRHRRPKWRSLYVWHRYMGLLAALVMLLISVTGIMLNHTGELELDQQYVTTDVLLNLYGIRTSGIVSFHTQGHWISQVDDSLYFDTKLYQRTSSNLTGAAQAKDMIVLTNDAGLHLLTTEGEVIEVLDEKSGIPFPVESIGIRADQFLLRAGGVVYRLNEDLTSAVPEQDGSSISWATPAQLPAHMRTTLVRKQLSSALPLERLVLDIHSGKILGPAGVYLFDLFSLVFMFLALSGISIWISQQVKRRKHLKVRQTQSAYEPFERAKPRVSNDSQ